MILKGKKPLNREEPRVKREVEEETYCGYSRSSGLSLR